MPKPSSCAPGLTAVWTGLLSAALAVALVGCGTVVSTTFENVGEEVVDPPVAAFDIALVHSTFSAECAHPIVVDALFCEQVRIDGMTANGTILNVPTTLRGTAKDRAAVICDVFAREHFDVHSGDDLGYVSIGVLDRNGENAAACTVQ